MKKIFIIVFLAISVLGYSKEFWEKKNFNVNVIEKSKINGKNRTKSYVMEYKDGIMKLTILSPSVNKGEIYTFTTKNKKVFYPKLNQTVVQNIKQDEVSLLNIFNSIKSLSDKKNKTQGSNKFIFEKETLKEVRGSGYKMEFLNYKKSGDYNYPSKMKLSIDNNSVDYELNNFK